MNQAQKFIAEHCRDYVPDEPLGEEKFAALQASACRIVDLGCDMAKYFWPDGSCLVDLVDGWDEGIQWSSDACKCMCGTGHTYDCHEE